MMRIRSLLLVLCCILATPSFAEDVISGPLTMAVSTQKKILVVRIGATEVRRYSVAVGTRAKPTPMGQFTVKHIVWNPAWHPPDANWAKGKQPAKPGDPKNPMKVVKLFFQEPDYYIHGTDQEDTLGAAASHGCVRMSQKDVYDLARFVQQNAGSPESDDWYAQVINGTKPADVHLKVAVPLVIGK